MVLGKRVAIFDWEWGQNWMGRKSPDFNLSEFKLSSFSFWWRYVQHFIFYGFRCISASEKKMWARGEAAKHSDPHKVEEALPLAITYQSDPKEASGSRIKQYITQHYGDCNIDKLKKSLESGIDKGLWELTRGSGMSGMYHLLIDTFNPSRSKYYNYFSDQGLQCFGNLVF